MKTILLLFKKDRTEFLSSYRGDKQKRDVFGVISSVFIIALLYGTFIYVFNNFASSYLKKTFGDPSAQTTRLRELMTMVYFVSVAVGIIIALKNLYSALETSEDFKVFMCQPIPTGMVLIYKLIKTYVSAVISSAVILLPTSIVCAGLSNVDGWFFPVIALHIILLPLMQCAVAAVLYYPLSPVLRFIDRKFVLRLIVYIVLLGAGFVLYGKFLDVFSKIVKKEVYITDETIEAISSVCGKLIPFNYFAGMLFGEHIVLSCLVLVAFSFASVVSSYYITRGMYLRTLQRKIEGEQIKAKQKKIPKKHSQTVALILKELKIVLRTPGYAFRYFATAVVCPLMVMICVELLTSFFDDKNAFSYEICTFAVSMFAVLTNTFCTSNISRDGQMFAMLKTMPVTGKKVVGSKIIFCMITAEVSALLSCLVLLVSGYMYVWQSVLVFVSSSVLSLGEIALATRKDLNKPMFEGGDGEITQSNSTTSVVAFLGILLSFVCGAGALAISLVLSIKYNLDYTAVSLISAGFVLVVVGTFSLISIAYLNRGLEKQFYNSGI